MTKADLTELMHAVLDGEATVAQKRALERQLASDPAARAEFEALRGIFDELKALPSEFPPEGLVASVMAGLPAHQLSGPTRVIGAKGNASNTNAARRPSRPWPLPGSPSMSEQQSGSKRKMWIGAGLVALAAIVVAYSGFDFPPGGTSTSGAIVPAQRYRADQPATTGVGQAAQADAQRTAQPTAGNAGDARASDGRASDSMKSDGRASDAMRSDGRTSDAMRSDGRASDAMKADGRTSDAMRSDGRTSDAMKSDGRTSDAMKSDGRTSDSMKADGRASDAMKADGRTSDSMKADGRTSDAMKSDGRTSDSMKADGRTSDAMRSDGRASDAMKSDGRTSDAMKADGRTSDSMKADGRASDSRVRQQ